MIGSFEFCTLCRCRVDVWRKHIKSPEHQLKSKEYLRNKKQEAML